MVTWVLEGLLARSPRPGRELGSHKLVPLPVVSTWLGQVRQFGIRSMVCLLAEGQLAFYTFPGGLLKYCAKDGFQVKHVPTEDHHPACLADSALLQIWNTYLELAKPVLLYCNTGERAQWVGQLLLEQLGQACPSAAAWQAHRTFRPYASRNDSLRFAEHTRKNLAFIQNAFASGAEVHVVTQLVNSFLGLLLFPWEAGLLQHMEARPVETLVEEGWPRWEIVAGERQTPTLGRLIRYLRNGVSRKQIHFSSDSQVLSEVEITIWTSLRKGQRQNWVGSLRADDLHVFCWKLMELLQERLV
jgi:hypothetical protein